MRPPHEELACVGDLIGVIGLSLFDGPWGLSRPGCLLVVDRFALLAAQSPPNSPPKADP